METLRLDALLDVNNNNREMFLVVFNNYLQIGVRRTLLLTGSPQLVDMWRDIMILEVINLAYISHKSAMTLENIILQTE